jgi:hypothetical protein
LVSPHGAAGGGEAAHKACLANAQHGNVALQTPAFTPQMQKMTQKTSFSTFFLCFF